MKPVKHIQQDMSTLKLSPKWEGPYVINKAYNTGYYEIIKEDGGKLKAVINGKWLKAYYARSSFYILPPCNATIRHCHSSQVSVIKFSINENMLM